MSFRKPICTMLVCTTLSTWTWVWTSNRCTNAAPQNKTQQSANRSNQPKKQDARLVETYLAAGKLQEGELALAEKLKEYSNDDQLRFALGTLQALRAIECLGQDLYRYGLGSNAQARELRFIPIIRMPLPNNPKPDSLSYNAAQNIIRTFLQNLSKAEATLAPIKDAGVKLPLHFGMIKLDLNGDGKADEEEYLWELYAKMNRNPNINAQTAKDFCINFDRGDVHWLRGYCHLLMSICEIYLAHDTKETFDCTAHLFFPKVDSPYGFLDNKGKRRAVINDGYILDLIALIHLIRWQVAEPERMPAALHHLEAVVAQSKESWKWILAESDDDREWLPNPRQTGVIPNMRVNEEMVGAWQNLMDQSGKVLAGELLIPFWRGEDDRGVNLRRVFMEPRTMDLVLWVQGTAAAPYLENGKKVESGIGRRLQDAFGSNLPGFAAYFN